MEDTELGVRIMRAATAQFVKHGYSKVTTDEIAASLGISKKTLYKCFPSKEELFRHTARMHLDELKDKLENLTKSKKHSFIEKLTESMRVIAEKLLEVGDFLKDNSMKLPRVHEEIMRRRQDIVVGYYRKLFREGVRYGHVNRGINETVFILMLITLLQHLFVPEVLARVPFTQVEFFTAIARTLLDGVLTEKTRMEFAKMRISFAKMEEVYWNA